MKLDVYNQEHAVVGSVTAPARVFDAKWRPALVHQALLAETSSARQPLAHTKDRSEVRGGGKKPYAQKHTGRARHGSSRSPLWSGGGITFGPRNDKGYAQKVTKQMRREALRSVLAKRAADGELSVIDGFAVAGGKTKAMAAVLAKFFGTKPNVLCVLAAPVKEVIRAGRNIPGVEVVTPTELSLGRALLHKHILIEQGALDAVLAVKSAN